MDDDLILLANPHRIRNKSKNNNRIKIEDEIIRLLNNVLEERGDKKNIDIDKFELIYKFIIQEIK